MNILLINHYAGSPDLGMEFRFFPRNNNPEVVQFQIFVLPLQLN